MRFDTDRMNTAKTPPGKNHAATATVPAMKSVGHLAAGAATTLLLVVLGIFTHSAKAADGCLVLLCLTAPSWSNISQCVDPVRSVMRDLVRGHPFPECSTSGRGNQASNQMAVAPGFCPPQYTHEDDRENGPVYSCDYTGAVDVRINGSPWSRTWWNPGGDSVTEFSDAAKAQLTDWDTRFEDDYAHWLATQPAPVPDMPSQGGG